MLTLERVKMIKFSMMMRRTITMQVFSNFDIIGIFLLILLRELDLFDWFHVSAGKTNHPKYQLCDIFLGYEPS